MRRFLLLRNEDASGVSGTGFVAEGVEFTDGRCVISWLRSVGAQGHYNSIDDVIAVHGHEGKTVVEWVDDEGEDAPPADEPDEEPEDTVGNVIAFPFPFAGTVAR